MGGAPRRTALIDPVMDAVFVLSLPAFRWEKAKYPSRQARFGHTCDIAKEGSPQLIVIGGVDYVSGPGTENADPWLRGIGVFDISNMEWKDKYDPSAVGYRTPEVIKSWYSRNGRYPMRWDSLAVQNLFDRRGESSFCLNRSFVGHHMA